MELNSVNSEQELFLLNWEIGDLIKKLRKFGSKRLEINPQTLNSLENLVVTVDTFLKNKKPTNKCEGQDNGIFDKFFFSRSVHCKQCNQAISTSKPVLVKHLKEHVCITPSQVLLQALKGFDKEKKTSKPTTDKLTQTEVKAKIEPGKLQKLLSTSKKKVKPVQVVVPQIDNRPKVDKEYVIQGRLREYTDGLTRRTKKFLNIEPRVFIKERATKCSEIANSSSYDAVLTNLEGLLKVEHPNVKGHLFGSRLLGLADDASDLDIFVDIYSNYDGSVKYSRGTLQAFILKFEKILKKSDSWSRVVPIISARTPILRAWNFKEKINCDMMFTNGLSLSNTVLTLYFFDLQPVCYYVTLYVKEWSRYLRMANLNSYTMTLMTIYYFQEYNLLPSLYELQTDCGDGCYITQWKTNFKRKSLDELGIPLIPECALETYILGFFSFYGSRFCFETNVVCPFLGWSPLKVDFDPKHNDIPVQMEDLRAFYDSLDMKNASPLHDLFAHKKPMVVQDPFELNHNVAKGLVSVDVSKIKQYCILTAELLEENFIHVR
ncbi:terminal uridylyltransferase Tailor-like [Toxorhynchites rutilus septentrionalis]|uniref:terminal uridylyltransferase Tailor-like n=1 Tax=Toxorhynchites rutilus septentrionalis TaxID=329112 RepID=UPI002478C95A|nr:terminal uridylyltransferase Tailor-like [Toxorhynchites rutilus septentrionalis]